MIQRLIQYIDRRVIDSKWGNTETLITKTKDPNYDGVRNLYEITNHDGDIRFTNGGKLNVETINVDGGNFYASDTDIVAKIVLLNNNWGVSDGSYTNATLGNLRITGGAMSYYVKVKDDNISIDREAGAYFDTLDTKNLLTQDL